MPYNGKLPAEYSKQGDYTFETDSYNQMLPASPDSAITLKTPIEIQNAIARTENQLPYFETTIDQNLNLK